MLTNDRSCASSSSSPYPPFNENKIHHRVVNTCLPCPPPFLTAPPRVVFPSSQCMVHSLQLLLLFWFYFFIFSQCARKVQKPFYIHWLFSRSFSSTGACMHSSSHSLQQNTVPPPTSPLRHLCGASPSPAAPIRISVEFLMSRDL